MEKDQYKKIQRINDVQKIISDLQSFFYAVDVWKEIPVQTKAIVRVKNKRSFSVFGSRFFGLGTHKSEISVPPTMIKELAQLTVEQIIEYKNELKQLLGE